MLYLTSLGSSSFSYRIEKRHLGGEQGPDMTIRNPVSGVGVIIESEVGHNITDRSYRKLKALVFSPFQAFLIQAKACI